MSMAANFFAQLRYFMGLLMRSGSAAVDAYLMPIVCDEFTDVATADVDAIKTSAASSNAVQSFTTADFDGVVGDGEMTPPRNITVTTSTHADIDAVAVVITGKIRNADGQLVDQTDTITLTDGGGATDAGVQPFSTVETVTIPAQSGSGGAVSVGFGAAIGLSAKIKSRGGIIKPLRELAAGAIATNGTFTNPTSSPVSLYTPNSAPDASRDYAVTYEVDPA
jgi:hypothetical protein